MKPTIGGIKRAFGYKLIGKDYLKDIVCRTVLVFPPEIINHVTKHCWFVGSFEDGWSFTLKATELEKNEYLIFLSDELLRQNEKQIRYTIAHEIGHVMLGHRNSIRKIQEKSEVSKQEKEAHEFAKYFLKK